MKDSNVEAFKKVFVFDILQKAISDTEEKTGSNVDGATDISWKLPSRTSALDSANSFLVAIYNMQQDALITIDAEDGDDATPSITEFEDLPASFIPPIEYILIKYLVILAETISCVVVYRIASLEVIRVLIRITLYQEI